MPTLEMSRTIRATAATVFEAFTDERVLARWFGPAGFTIPSVRFEARVGARYRIEMQPPEGDAFHLTGEVRAVDAPTRLAYTFMWEDPDPDDVETRVELSFREAGGSTEANLMQGEFKTDARRELHRAGWSDSFDKLDRLLA